MLKSLRRKATGLGLRIAKKRGEDRYMLIDARDNFVICGTNSGIPYDMSLADVKDYLDSYCCA